MTPGESTRLAGMLLAAFAGRARFGSLRAWTIGGCFVSAAALASLALGGLAGPGL
jgi:BCD family chlorophyll transporter-like MFS transporter